MLEWDDEIRKRECKRMIMVFNVYFVLNAL